MAQWWVGGKCDPPFSIDVIFSYSQIFFLCGSFLKNYLTQSHLVIVTVLYRFLPLNYLYVPTTLIPGSTWVRKGGGGGGGLKKRSGKICEIRIDVTGG